MRQDKKKAPSKVSVTNKRPKRAATVKREVLVAASSSPSKLAIALFATFAASCVYWLFTIAPEVAAAECDQVRGITWFLQGAVRNSSGTALVLSQCAQKYDELHPNWTLVLYVSVYLLLQTFAIPGPLILSLISGVLWPLWKAQLVIAFCATVGASLCYQLSAALQIGEWLTSLNPQRALQFRSKVSEAEASGKLLYFMLFLRISPMLPNWFVNLASPVAGVPLRTFALATALGLVPANILHYNTGQQLHEMVISSQKGSTMRNFLILISLQFVALIPTLFKSQIQQRFQVKDD